MTKTQLEQLTQIHHTLGLIHASHAFQMTPAEEALFSCALEELYDVIEADFPNQPPGSEYPASVEERWEALK
jgi:hypothetical protein